MKRSSLASLFLALAPLAMSTTAAGFNVREAAQQSLADKRMPYLYAGTASDPAKDPKYKRVASIVSLLHDERVVPFLKDNNIKIDFGVVPQGSMAVVKNNVILVNIMASGYDQLNAVNGAVDFIKAQKVDGLPFQPACFSAGYNHNSGLRLIPQGC